MPARPNGPTERIGRLDLPGPLGTGKPGKPISDREAPGASGLWGLGAGGGGPVPSGLAPSPAPKLQSF